MSQVESCYTSRPIEQTTPRCAAQVDALPGGRWWLAISPGGGTEASSSLNGFKAPLRIAGSSVVEATRVGESSVVTSTKSSIILNFDRIRALGLEVTLLLTVGAGHTRNYMTWLNKSKE